MSMSELRLYGIPRDGSAPFVMAHVESIERGREIYNQTFRHYVQDLGGWEIRDAQGKVLKRNVPLLAE